MGLLHIPYNVYNMTRAGYNYPAIHHAYGLISTYKYVLDSPEDSRFKENLYVIFCDVVLEELKHYYSIYEEFTKIVDSIDSILPPDATESTKQKVDEYVSRVRKIDGQKYAQYMKEDVNLILTALSNPFETRGEFDSLIREIMVYAENLVSSVENLLTFKYDLEKMIHDHGMTLKDAIYKIGGNGKVIHKPSGKVYKVRKFVVRGKGVDMRLLDIRLQDKEEWDVVT